MNVLGTSSHKQSNNFLSTQKKVCCTVMALLIAFCHLCITSPLFAQEQSLAPGEQATLTISNAQEPAELVQVPISETEASIIASPLIEQDPTLTTLDIQVPNEVQAQEPESIETTQDTNNTQESQQPSIATIINNAPADNTQENTSITNSDGAQLVVPEQYIVFDKIGRVQIETLQSVSTIGGPEDITYCSRIARENIQNLLAAGGQDISTFTIARGDAEVLIAQGVANRTIFALEQKDVSTTLQSLFDSNKNTIYDLYISHVIGENHIGHRVTVVLGTDNNFYVLDPIWGNKSTSGQTLSDYLSYFNTNAQFYISNIGYNPILKEKEIWLNANDIVQDQNVSVNVTSQLVQVEDLGGDSSFEDMTDFQVEKIADNSFIIGDPNAHLEFSEPIEIQVQVDLEDNTPVPLQVKHEGDSEFGTHGLTTDPEATCANGISSNESALALVKDGKITFYSCAASTFMVDLGFSPGGADGFDGPIFKSIVQPDGKVVVVGDFTNYTGNSWNRIARFTTGGSIDTTFSIGEGFNDIVNTIVYETGGKLIVGGYFTDYDGNAVNRIVRLNSDGSIDTGFSIGSGFNGSVHSIAIETGGKIIVGGLFTGYNGVNQTRITRLTTTGARDTSFIVGGGFDSNVLAISIETGGKIVVGGAFTAYSGVNQNRITRLTTTGARDTSFIVGTGFNGTVLALAIETGGKIVAGGAFTGYSGVIQNRITRLTTTGARDTSFIIGTGFNSTVTAMTIETGGKIIVGGLFGNYSGTVQNYITRLTTTGRIDTSFIIGIGFNNTVKTVSLQSDGKIIVGGHFSSYSGTVEKFFVRLTSTGRRDVGFAVPGGTVNGGVQVVALQSDGKIIAGGLFTTVNGTGRNRLMRLESGGVLDSSFSIGSGFNSGVLALAIQSDGKVIVGGDFTTYQGTGRNRLVRLHTNGSIDTGFDVGTAFNNTVNSVALQSDGKVIVGGAFTSYKGTARNRIIRLTSTGALDTTFTIAAGFNSTVNVVKVQSDDKILVGGQFTTYAGVNQRRIARLTTTGARDTFTVGAGGSNGANSTVFAIAIQNSGEVIIGGAFTSYGGVTRTRIARLSSTGALDTTYIVGGGFNSTVNDITIDSSNRAVVVGAFTGYSGSSLNRIARLTSTGRADTSFQVGGAFDAPVNSVLIQPDLKILVGGSFTSFSGEIQNGIARLSSIEAPTFINPSSGEVQGGSTLFVIGTGEANATITVQISGKTLSDTISSTGYWTLTFTGLATGNYVASGYITTDNNISDTARVSFIVSGGAVCISSPSIIMLTGTDASNSGQTLEIQLDYFSVDDQKGASSGYYTTLSISHLSGSSGNLISNTGIQWKADPIVLLSGTDNSLVYVETGITTYVSAAITTNFIARDPDPIGGILGTYGSMLRLRVSIPAYTSVDAYSGTITYTIYEN